MRPRNSMTPEITAAAYSPTPAPRTASGSMPQDRQSSASANSRANSAGSRRSAMVLSRGKRGEQRLIRVRTQKTRAAIHRRAKHGLGGVKLERGAGIANPPRQTERQRAARLFSWSVRRAVPPRNALRRLPRRKGSERFPQLLFAFGNHGHAAREVRSAGVGAEADVHEIVFGMFRKMLLVAAREILDRTFRPSGERQDVAGAARQTFRPGSCRRFFDNHVRVRAAKSKTAHACETPSARAARAAACWESRFACRQARSAD